MRLLRYSSSSPVSRGSGCQGFPLFGKERTGIASPLVKSSINPRIRRNSNGIFILDNDHSMVVFGFVRITFAVFPPRAHPMAADRDRVRIAHVAWLSRGVAGTRIKLRRATVENSGGLTVGRLCVGQRSVREIGSETIRNAFTNHLFNVISGHSTMKTRRMRGGDMDWTAYIDSIPQESAFGVLFSHFLDVAIGVSGEAGVTG